MTLRIDTSRPFRTLHELEVLVRAVVAADEHDESSWLEWKSTLDLATREGQFAVARAVLGLSNRSVADAARQCEGCGYVVVGADHTGLHGVVTVDHAVLEQGLAPYVGTGAEAPRWSPRNLDVDGHQILVITVEAPHHGDRIHTLRKTYGRVPAGAVLVRGKAKVEAATPGEITMLEERLLAGAREPDMAIEVTMRAPQQFSPVQPASDGDIDAWIARRVRAIWDGAPAEAWPPAQNTLGIKIPDYASTVTVSQRRKFSRLVSEHIDHCSGILPRALIRQIVESDVNKLAVRVANGTESTLTAVMVVAELEGSADDVYIDPPQQSRLPKPPKWHDADTFGGLSLAQRADVLDSIPVRTRPGSAVAARDGDIIRVSWSLGDVHVRQSVVGEQITVIPALDVDHVRIRWHATASNRTGVIEGEWLFRSEPGHPYTLALLDDESQA